MTQNKVFVLILIIFAVLYASINLSIPVLGNIGVIAFVLVVLTQIFKI